MSYVQGFILAVPTQNKRAYLDMAAKSAPLFKEFGAIRQVEAWGDDVPDGKVTDFKKSVKAEDGETVVFSWMEYPDRATYEAAKQKSMSDPRMKDMGDMPFDGKRMIYGGFDPLIDEHGEGKTGYADGYVVPVPTKNRQAYRDAAAKAATVFKEYGAIRVVESWGDDVPDGQVTDFKRSVKAKDDETVVFSYVEWPSKQVRDAAWPKMMEDPRMKPAKDMPFDGQRMFWGGFQPILDEGNDSAR